MILVSSLVFIIHCYKKGKEDKMETQTFKNAILQAMLNQSSFFKIGKITEELEEMSDMAPDRNKKVTRKKLSVGQTIVFVGLSDDEDGYTKVGQLEITKKTEAISDDFCNNVEDNLETDEGDDIIILLDENNCLFISSGAYVVKNDPDMDFYESFIALKEEHPADCYVMAGHSY